ncbi:helix-turn-helix domain-containing protein [Microbacterium sp. J1-1]|uniref:helix-turn-helix domain-containing protein n=1 Tax=Microbacterium sp. J1-1 TaxID=2992441 RepID=UPI0021149934|nr:helix-turn-helix transcriptional regulator [Microbacterium sp. J1-1]UUE20444.1 helix-turn-helix domain-containing protein [Microbacterium sp. J1-1]
MDAHIGRRIAEVRQLRSISQTDFGQQVRELVGAGWSRQVVWQVERGEKPVSASDLVAVAHVLSCTVADLTSTTEAVSLGGSTVPRTDAIVGGVEAMPEAEGMARFREAAEALADVRHAWERYAHLIDVARRRVAEVSAVERQVRRYGEKALQDAVRQMRDGFGRLPDFDAEAAARRNPSPAMLAAADALGTYRVPENGWMRGAVRRERSGQ